MRKGWTVFERTMSAYDLFGPQPMDAPARPWERRGVELLLEDESRVLIGDVGMSWLYSDEGCGCCCDGRPWRVIAWRDAYVPL